MNKHAEEMKKFGVKEQNDTHVIRSKMQFSYCPICGRQTSRTDNYTETRIECPKHGELLL